MTLDALLHVIRTFEEKTGHRPEEIRLDKKSWAKLEKEISPGLTVTSKHQLGHAVAEINGVPVFVIGGEER